MNVLSAFDPRTNYPFRIGGKKQLKILSTFRERRATATRIGKATVHSERKEQKTLRNPDQKKRITKHAQHLRNLNDRREAQRGKNIWPGIGRHAGLSSNRRRGK